MELNILIICYLIGSITFIIGLKMLSHPESARKGNLIAAAGMAISILGTIFLYEEEGIKLGNYIWIFAALIIGTVLGTIAAKKVKMTAMPEMVSLFNGMGGACAALISIVEFDHLNHQIQLGGPVNSGTLLIIFAGLIIGTISFAGSMVAWAKLNGRIKDFAFNGQHIMNLVIFAVIICLSAYLIISGDPATGSLFYLVFVLSIIYGLFFVLPIGGADMPVVISLLNSFTGVAAAFGGFLYDNPVMLTGGILVGSAGTILTILMCKAMNRPLSNVLIGSFGGSSSGSVTKDQGAYKEISISDSAIVMSYAKKVMIVPGYGLAVAQAQHVCHELEKLLSDKGVEVNYAIHPVAGRMPGHMNVLLAEADVDYARLLEMDDVVNPAAKTDPGSPIYGMPVLDVELSKLVIINKRSMNPGYAGIENELFFQPKSSMLFGDAKSVLQKLVAEIKTL
jgi:H+-translocating NAD(P) transhydrogenase subunit beta